MVHLNQYEVLLEGVGGIKRLNQQVLFTADQKFTLKMQIQWICSI
jgi:hypothetical protein